MRWNEDWYLRFQKARSSILSFWCVEVVYSCKIMWQRNPWRPNCQNKVSNKKFFCWNLWFQSPKFFDNFIRTRAKMDSSPMNLLSLLIFFLICMLASYSTIFSSCSWLHENHRCSRLLLGLWGNFLYWKHLLLFCINVSNFGLPKACWWSCVVEKASLSLARKLSHLVHFPKAGFYVSWTEKTFCPQDERVSWELVCWIQIQERECLT